MTIDSAIHSWLGPATAGALARTIPPPMLRRMAAPLARGFAARHARGRVCETIRHNQAMVRGVSPDHRAVDLAVTEVLVNAALGFVDLYSTVARGRRAVRAACHIDEEVRRRGEECLEAGRGMVLVGPHMVGFELLILGFGLMGYDAQALSDPRPTGSHRCENAARRRFGLHTTPVSRSSIAEAETSLERNGVVLTGVDIPTPHGETLPFFGRAARMPTLHAQLAIRHGSPVLLAVPRRDGDNQYRVEIGGVFVSTAGDVTPSRVKELTVAVLSATEAVIASRPDHWKMLRRVWPERMQP